MYECYSFRVGIRGYDARQLRLQETSTQFSQDGGTFTFPDGFTMYEQDKEVGRLPLEEVEICPDHENCFISLPSMFSLELRSSRLVVLLDEQKFCTAMRSSAAEVLDAYRVIPILLHRLSELRNSELKPVEPTDEEDDPLLSRHQKQLCNAMKALGSNAKIAESTVIRIGNTSFWADLGQHCIVEKPNLELCDLECHGGLIVSQPGFGRKRAVLAYAKALPAPIANAQEEETLLCHFPVGVICAPAELEQWISEANLLSCTVLLIPDARALSMLTVESFCKFQVVVISSKVLESSGFWACPHEYKDPRFRRCDLVMHMRRLGQLNYCAPMLDLVYWKMLIFAEPIKPILVKQFVAGQSWVLLPGSNLIQLHRAWELIQPDCDADFPLHEFAKNFGLYWAPSLGLPQLSKESIAIELTSLAKAYLLQESWSKDGACGPIKQRKMLVKRERLCSAVLSNNSAHLRKLEAYIKKLRVQEKLWHRELEREEQPVEWDETFLGDWAAVRDQIVQTELDHVESSLKLIAKTHQLFSRVEQHHLEAALADECPICGEENEAIFRCGHGTCWACTYTMFSEKKQIKCPQCRTSLVRNDVWLIANDRGQSKFQLLTELLENIDKPCLILMETSSGCRAAARALKQFGLAELSGKLEERIYIGKYSTHANQHLALKHLILMHPMKDCEPIIQHIGNPNGGSITTLYYKEFETV